MRRNFSAMIRRKGIALQSNQSGGHAPLPRRRRTRGEDGADGPHPPPTAPITRLGLPAKKTKNPGRERHSPRSSRSSLIDTAHVCWPTNAVHSWGISANIQSHYKVHLGHWADVTTAPPADLYLIAIGLLTMRCRGLIAGKAGNMTGCFLGERSAGAAPIDDGR